MLTLRWWVTVNTPLLREIRQSFRASNTELLELDDPSSILDDPSSILDDPSSILDDPSPIKSAMRYTWSEYHAGSNSMRMRNTHYII